MRAVNVIVVHCSNSDYKHHDNVESIRKWHVDENGWSDIGYHFIITKDGRIHVCRPIHRAGAHTKGHNHNSIGICLTGSKFFSDEQFKSLKLIVDELSVELGLDKNDVYPHRYFNKNKTCPNFDIKTVL